MLAVHGAQMLCRTPEAIVDVDVSLRNHRTDRIGLILRARDAPILVNES